MRVLVTGAAGFIGYHISERLLVEGHTVLGIDNINGYYDHRLKRARLGRLTAHPDFQFLLCDVADRGSMEGLFGLKKFDAVIHLAAQAGVRHSIDNPHAYTRSNLTGFLHVLEGCRCAKVPHLIYASSSSVYGGSTQVPFRTEDRVYQPVSLYAATKRANELMAHCYSHLFGLAATGLRFFTVYGPWGRPDMAPFRFAQAIGCGKPIDLYNYGRMQRDFTYIDDIVEGLARVAALPACGHRVFNIGLSQPVGLLDFVHALEQAFGRRARRRFLPMQAGDVVRTWADVEPLWQFTGFRPRTSVADGVARFVDWFRGYYGVPVERQRLARPRMAQAV